MSPRRTQNLDMLAAVAKGLRDLKEKVVFVGGATIDLYLDDPAVTGARTPGSWSKDGRHQPTSLRKS